MPLVDVPPELAADMETRPRPGPGRVITAALSVLLLSALIILGLPWVADASWPQILGTLSELPAPVVLASLLLAVAAVLLEGIALRLALPGTTTLRALPASAAASATSLAIPGGAFLGIGLMSWMLRRGGLAASSIIVGIAAVSATDLLVTSLLVPLIGLVAYVVAGVEVDLPGVPLAVISAMVSGALTVGVLLAARSRRLLELLLTQLSRQDDTDEDTDKISDFVRGVHAETLAILRRRGVAMTLMQLSSRAAHCLVLVMAVLTLDVQVPIPAIVAVFVLGRVLALLPLTPGGAGITEAATAAALVALGAAGADAAAASLLLLVTTLVVPVLLGAASISFGARAAGR